MTEARILAAATTQSLFDYVARHASNMKHPSIIQTKGGTFNPCMYRGPDDQQCFIGCLITDDEYHHDDGDLDDFENGSTDVEALHERGQLPERLVPHLDLLMDLQPVHDNNRPHTWPQELIEIGTRFNLDTSLVTELADKMRAVPPAEA